MKLCLLILLVCMIMMVALGIVQQYREKNKLYLELNSFLQQYEFNISFKKEKLKNLVESFLINKKTSNIFTHYLGYLTKDTKLDFSEIKILENDEKDFLVNMFVSIGKDDTFTEKNKLLVYKKYLEEKIEETKLKKDKACPMILKLTLLFAIGVAILFI